MDQPVAALVRMVAAVDDRPTLAQVDAILAQLTRIPDAPEVTALVEDMLDYRLLAATAPDEEC